MIAGQHRAVEWHQTKDAHPVPKNVHGLPLGRAIIARNGVTEESDLVGQLLPDRLQVVHFVWQEPLNHFATANFAEGIQGRKLIAPVQP